MKMFFYHNEEEKTVSELTYHLGENQSHWQVTTQIKITNANSKLIPSESGSSRQIWNDKRDMNSNTESYSKYNTTQEQAVVYALQSVIAHERLGVEIQSQEYETLQGVYDVMRKNNA